MGSQYLARLGVVLGIDTAKWEADINQAIAANQKLKREITRETKAAEKELLALGYAVKDYGKEITKVEQLQRDFLSGGRFANAAQNVKDKLLQEAAAYDKLREATKKANAERFAGMGGTSLSRQQIAALGYQTTDILTGLAGGQNPLLILIQQGGQLRDQFGGFIPLFKAIKSVFTETRVIAAGLGAALGIVSYAVYKNNEEFKEFRNNLALTNNILGITFDQSNRLAETIAKKTSVSVADAKSIMLEFAKSGKVSAQALEPAAQAVANIAKLSGQTASEVARSLIPSLNGTAASAKTLNEQYNFLTLAQFKQIEALELAGKKQEAVKLTLNLLNKSIEDQKTQLQIADGWWTRLTTTIVNFWEKVKESASDSLEIRLKNITALIEKLESKANKTPKDIAALEKAKQTQAELAAEVAAKQIAAAEEARKKQAESDAIAIYEGEKKRREILAETAKIYSDAEFQEKVANADKFQRIDLEAEKKKRDASLEYMKQTEASKYQFLKEYGDQYNARVIAAEKEAAQKKLEIARLAGEEVRKEQQARLDSIELEKAKLQIYEQNLFITEKDYKIALNRLKLEQELAKISENKDLDAAKREEAVNRALNIKERSDELATLEDKLKHLRDVNQSVWKNMESALESFVRTGKFSFKDFARSVIQDILMIYMKSQMLQMFNMGKGALSNFFSSGTNMYTDSSGMFQVGMALADGGQPPVGVPSLVGERGPELFVPKTAGTIIPNEKLSSVMGGNTYVTNNNIQAIDVKSFEDRILASPNAVWAANKYADKSLQIGRGRT